MDKTVRLRAREASFFPGERKALKRRIPSRNRLTRCAISVKVDKVTLSREKQKRSSFSTLVFSRILFVEREERKRTEDGPETAEMVEKI